MFIDKDKYKNLSRTLIISYENLKESIHVRLIMEFEVNEFITLRLEGDNTFIYINGRRFQQCKFLNLDISINKLSSFEEVESADESFEKLKGSLKNNNKRYKSIPPEIIFWGHCSNLQVWVENKYNTRLLPYTLAFPLLKKLTIAGDPIAQQVFKKEIEKRLKSGFPSVVTFLIKERYVDYLDHEELRYIKTLKNAKITLFIFIINLFIFIALNLILPYDYFLMFIQINQNIIERFEIWRLFTSIFLHTNAAHLILNMILLIIFGVSIEINKNFSAVGFLIIFFLSGLIGNLSYLILLPMNSTGLGSSGAIFGLIGANFVITTTKKRYFILFLLFLIIFLFLYISLAPRIVFWAHLFGFIVGLLFGYLFVISN